MTEYTAEEFRRFFRRHYLRRLKQTLDPAMRPLDLTVEDNIVAVLKDFESILGMPGTTTSIVPKNLWLLWQQGWNKAPAIVRRCAESWQENNNGWTIYYLDDQTLPDYAPDYPAIRKERASRAARSDLARICLLARHGGVWADATSFCQRPLDEWIPKVARDGLFMLDRPRPYRPYDSWFIVSSDANYTLTAMREMFTQYWGYFGKAHAYFWILYLFEYLANRDPRVMSEWRCMPKINAQGALVLGANALNRVCAPAVFDMVGRRLVPVHKLSHKWRHEGTLRGTPLHRLTGLESL